MAQREQQNVPAEGPDDIGTGPLDLDALLARVETVEVRDRDNVIAILKDLVPCTEGETAQVLEALAEASKYERQTLAFMLKDEKSRFKDRAIVTKPMDLAQAWVECAREELGDEGCLVRCYGKWWVYYPDEKEHPHFVEYSDEKLEAAIDGDAPHHPLMQRAASRREVLRCVASIVQDDSFFDEAAAGLPMKNGFLAIDPVTGDAELLPHGPQHRARHVVDADYDIDAKCPTFDAGMERIMPEEETRLSFFEVGSAIALNCHPPGDYTCTVTLVVGPPGGGKSTVADLLGLFIPKEQTVSLQPADMSQNFMAASLRGMRLNVVTELDTDRPFGGSMFKAIASRERITTRGIRERPGVLHAQAFHLLMANEVPALKDKTQAFARRICAFRLDQTLNRDNTDPNYGTKVKAELSGVVNVLVAGAKRAIQRGRFARPIEHDELMAEMRQERDLITRAIGRKRGPLRPEQAARAEPQALRRGAKVRRSRARRHQ